MFKLNENKKIEFFNLLANVLIKSSFDKDDPIPIATVFYNLDTLEVIDVFENENTLGLEKKDKYLKHGEYLGISEGVTNKYENVGCVITIPPCPDCYVTLSNDPSIKHIFYLTHNGGSHKLFKIRDLVKKGHREITVERLNMKSENEKKAFSNVRMQLRNIEKWMRNS